MDKLTQQGPFGIPVDVGVIVDCERGHSGFTVTNFNDDQGFAIGSKGTPGATGVIVTLVSKADAMALRDLLVEWYPYPSGSLQA